MARTPSPLRYPGGKASLLTMVSSILRLNKLDRGVYVEPFAGGGGLALCLLFKGDVGEIMLNDIDPAIAALWRAMLNNATELIDLMHHTPISLDERNRQREIYFAKADCDVTLGFATLYLNRVNRSGIIKTGGVIGGMAQLGKYLIDCRFNKVDLEARIKRIHKYRNRIHFTSQDAGNFLRSVADDLPTRSLIYADPPYYVQGAELYTSSFKPEDHAIFRDRLLEIDRPWILTYDNTPEIQELYRARRQYAFDINYSVQSKRVGSELLIASKNLKVPPEVGLSLSHRPQHRAASVPRVVAA